MAWLVEDRGADTQVDAGHSSPSAVLAAHLALPSTSLDGRADLINIAALCLCASFSLILQTNGDPFFSEIENMLCNVEPTSAKVMYKIVQDEGYGSSQKSLALRRVPNKPAARKTRVKMRKV